MNGEFVDGHGVNKDGLKDRFDQGDTAGEIKEFGGPGEDAFFEFVDNFLKYIFSCSSNVKRDTEV